MCIEKKLSPSFLQYKLSIDAKVMNQNKKMYAKGVLWIIIYW